MGMTRDEVRIHFYEGNATFIRNKDGFPFIMTAHNSIHGYIQYARLLPNNGRGRLRILDITGFCKTFSRES